MDLMMDVSIEPIQIFDYVIYDLLQQILDPCGLFVANAASIYEFDVKVESITQQTALVYQSFVFFIF